MVCLVCSRLGRGLLCPDCRLLMFPAPERLASPQVVVRPALLHTGPARTLVHLLKYRGVVAAGAILAEHMAPLVPPGAVLVPVPRLGWRILKYGVDPALELAAAVSRQTGCDVARILHSPWFGRSRAGRSRGAAPRFRLEGSPPAHVVLIDDVVTTGATLASAQGTMAGWAEAVTATARTTRRPARVMPGNPQLASLRGGLELGS